MSDFILWDRKAERTLFLLPGWATDYRVFTRLDVPFNYLLPKNNKVPDVVVSLMKYCQRHGRQKVSLLGWSAGGYAAAGFIKAWPEMVEHCYLVGMREHYDKLELELMAQQLQKNCRTRLRRFYRDCFGPNSDESWRWFKQELMPEYLRTFTRPVLQCGLEALAIAALPSELPDGKVTFVQGSHDKIAGPDTLSNLQKKYPAARFWELEGGGHLSFLEPSFARQMNDE